MLDQEQGTDMAVAATQPEPVEIASIEDLQRVVREVQADRTSVVVRVLDEGEVILKPAPRRRTHLTREERKRRDMEVSISAAGGWAGLVDGEALKQQIREARGQRSHPWEAKLFDE